MDWGWIVAALVAAAILNDIFKPKKCSVCRQRFKKKYTTWKISGKKMHLCPNCNSQMERKISTARFRDKFGK